MSQGFCRVHGIGHLGRDPEVTFTSSGLELSKFTVAVNRKKGEQEITDWFSLVVYDKLASTANQYLHKGSHLYFEGRLETFEYTKDEQKRKGYDIVVTSFTMLDPKKTESEGTAPHAAGVGAGKRASGEEDEVPF